MKDNLTENTELPENVVLPGIAASVATLNVLICVLPKDPDFSDAAIMAFVATGLWSTVILERAKNRTRIKNQKTNDDSDDVKVSPVFLLRYNVVFALAYTVLTCIWAFVVGLWWIALALLPLMYWYHAYTNWKKTRASFHQNG